LVVRVLAVHFYYFCERQFEPSNTVPEPTGVGRGIYARFGFLFFGHR
jgi:hypothetical protein